jgi:hypothetical protein
MILFLIIAMAVTSIFLLYTADFVQDGTYENDILALILTVIGLLLPFFAILLFI